MKNQIKCIVYVLTFYFTLSNFTHCSAEKYVIGNPGSGFFSSFICTLNHLIWCEENNKIPVVYWGENSQFYSSKGFNGAMNVWEYYFEPVSDLSYCCGDHIDTSCWPQTNYTIYVWMLDTVSRVRINQLINRYVKLKPAIKNKIDDFYKSHMEGKKTIGIHLRGTDKCWEQPSVALETLINKAIEIADATTQFYIASEDERLFERAKEMLKGRVIYYDVIRSSNDGWMWQGQHPQRAQLGEDVLIEAQLLSKCHALVHTYSNVSTAALFFNPYMENFLFYNLR